MRAERVSGDCAEVVLSVSETPDAVCGRRVTPHKGPAREMLR
jgi:hypothetical protein